MAKNDKFIPRELYNLDINLLQPDIDQPRKVFDETALKELAESIKTLGVLQPIIFRVDKENKHIIVAGERRYRASLLAGLKEIPAIYTEGNPTEIALVENMLREDLTPVEEAEALAKMRDEHDYTQDQLAKLLGMSRNTISEILSINNLSEEIRNDCREDIKCSKSKLIEIAKEKTPKKMEKLYEHVKKINMTTLELREMRKKGSKRSTQNDVVRTQILSLVKKIESMPEHLEKEREDMLVKELNKLVDTVTKWVDKVSEKK